MLSDLRASPGQMHLDMVRWYLLYDGRALRHVTIEHLYALTDATPSIPRSFGLYSALPYPQNDLFLRRLQVSDGWFWRPGQPAAAQPAIWTDDLSKVQFRLTLSAVTKNGMALQGVRGDLLDNVTIVLAAVTNAGRALRFASDAMRSDRAIVLAAVMNDGAALQYAMTPASQERAIVLAAVTADGGALKFAPDALRSDESIVMTAIQNHGRAIVYAHAQLQSSRSVATAAVSQDGSSLHVMSDVWRDDEAVVLAAVSQNGTSLVFASPAMQDNLKVVLAAHGQNPRALKHASSRIKRRLRLDLGIVEGGTEVSPRRAHAHGETTVTFHPARMFAG